MSLFSISTRIEIAIKSIRRDVRAKCQNHNLSFVQGSKNGDVDNRRLEFKKSLYRRAAEFEVNPRHLMVILGVVDRERHIRKMKYNKE